MNFIRPSEPITILDWNTARDILKRTLRETMARNEMDKMVWSGKIGEPRERERRRRSRKEEAEMGVVDGVGYNLI